MDLDKVTNAPVVGVAEAAMTVIDRLQHFPPEQQVMGAIAAAQILLDHYRLRLPDVGPAVTNIMNHAAGRRPEFAAIADYVAGELP